MNPPPPQKTSLESALNRYYRGFGYIISVGGLVITAVGVSLIFKGSFVSGVFLFIAGLWVWVAHTVFALMGKALGKEMYPPIRPALWTLISKKYRKEFEARQAANAAAEDYPPSDQLL